MEDSKSKVECMSEEHVAIGEFPVMVGSCLCLSVNADGTRKSQAHLDAMGLDSTIPGIFFWLT